MAIFQIDKTTRTYKLALYLLTSSHAQNFEFEIYLKGVPKFEYTELLLVRPVMKWFTNCGKCFKIKEYILIFIHFNDV